MRGYTFLIIKANGSTQIYHSYGRTYEEARKNAEKKAKEVNR